MYITKNYIYVFDLFCRVDCLIVRNYVCIIVKQKAFFHIRNSNDKRYNYMRNMFIISGCYVYITYYKRHLIHV